MPSLQVRARGELSLAVLIETMRREGFELSVSPPAVLFKTTPSGERQEPYEHVVVDVDDECVGVHGHVNAYGVEEEMG